MSVVVGGASGCVMICVLVINVTGKKKSFGGCEYHDGLLGMGVDTISTREIFHRFKFSSRLDCKSWSN